jgi:hypothetical protein
VSDNSRDAFRRELPLTIEDVPRFELSSDIYEVCGKEERKSIPWIGLSSSIFISFSSDCSCGTMPDFCFFLSPHISVRLDCCGGADLADEGISKNLA